MLDPFGGSGTTLIAADHTGRRARLIELDPKYVDVIVYRWQDQHERLRDSRKFGGELRNGVRKDAIFRVMTAVKSGLVYFCLVFAAGFLLGTVRVIVLIPRLGELYSVFLELPIILSISWVGCQWTVHRFHVKEEIAPRSVMGIAAFGLLMFAELGLSVFGFGRSVAAHFAAYQSLPALLGLAGQIAFAIFPVAQLFRRL